MGRLLQVFWLDDRGATAIEYGLIAALIAIIALVGIASAGGSIANMFGYVSNKSTSVWDGVN